MPAARSRIATIVAALALIVAVCIGSDHGSARAAVGQATGPLIGSPLAGAAILAADGMAPGDVRTGYISVTNIGDISGSFALGSAGLTDTPLSRELDLDVQDVTPGGAATRVYSGKLASRSSVMSTSPDNSSARFFAASPVNRTGPAAPLTRYTRLPGVYDFAALPLKEATQ